MIDPDLLKILCCPETRMEVFLADTALVEALNEQIVAGRLKNGAGELVAAKLESGLVRSDRKVLYPVRDGIAVMLVNESIPLT